MVDLKLPNSATGARPSGAQAAQGGAQQRQPAASAPSVGGFRLQGRRTKSPQEISKRFSELAFLEMSSEKDTLSVLNVESRDIQKNPFLFSIIYFRPEVIEVNYTCLAAMSPKKRRIDVLRHFLNLLTIAEDCYEFEMKQIFQLLEASVADMTEYVSLDYDRVYSLYDNLKTDYSGQQKKIKELSEGNAQLSKENYELKSRNDELTLKLRSLETFSDSVLSLKIQEWLSEHKGEINIADFSKVYNVPENRVEQMLNKLVTEGYLETKG
ncbi:Uncharacterised protein [uncultured archaeon]|nr:Uncharacterised protein [uncultured archaeon]